LVDAVQNKNLGWQLKGFFTPLFRAHKKIEGKVLIRSGFRKAKVHWGVDGSIRQRSCPSPLIKTTFLTEEGNLILRSERAQNRVGTKFHMWTDVSFRAVNLALKREVSSGQSLKAKTQHRGKALHTQ